MCIKPSLYTIEEPQIMSKRLKESRKGRCIYHLTCIIPLFQNFKNSLKNQKWSDRQKSTSQVADIILHACMNFENYPMKTVVEDTFYSYYILYHYFKISKNSPKI